MPPPPDVEPGSCFVMFHRFEVFALERIVGTKCGARMVASPKASFLFCTQRSGPS